MNIKRIVAGRGAALILAGLLVAGVLLWPRSDSHPIDFNKDIRPIFNDRCIACHGGVRRESGFSLLFPEDALAANKSGQPAILPGEAGRSELIRRVTSTDPDKRMPQQGDPLTSEQIDTLRRWIDEGAKWADHWAYVPPREAELPAVSDSSWPRNGIDYFVLARLEQEGLSPSEPAPCATLIRRVSLDLVGLPPTPEQVAEYCADPSPEAFSRVVDRLLASPSFGERWAAMWLDLARYADSKGYEADRHRVIWRYRDWVIDAFNRDVPFDRFALEQLAGDLLPDAAVQERIATAFHRNTMNNDEGGTDDEEFRSAAVIDRVNTTFEIWQGTTIGCVQCHSHPYDPFRQREYYELFAFFNNTADADQVDERPLLYSFEEPVRERGTRLLSRVRSLESELQQAAYRDDIIAERRAWEERLRALLPSQPKPTRFEGTVLPDKILQIVKISEPDRLNEQQVMLNDFYNTVTAALEGLRKELEEQSKALQKLEPVTTPIMEELPEQRRRTTQVFERGNWAVRGEKVDPDVPESLNPFPETLPRNRQGMAQWLFHADNPLTSRVSVNRFWAQLFGTGLVETLEDFGTRGSPPSHPELLDWLALEFRNQHRWSVKSLLKQMVTSSTYRQASVIKPGQWELDPRNRLLARGPRFRLSAEQIHDQALAVSGLLSSKMYGPSVFPYQPPGLWDAPYDARVWTNSEGEDLYRRALYTYWRRSVPYPSMVTFDAAGREVCTSRRITTNIPLQALVLMNDPVYVEAAQALARRMAEAAPEAAGRLEAGYRLALGESPGRDRLQLLSQLYEDAVRDYQEKPEAAALMAGSESSLPEQAALTVVANALLNLDEFVTKD